MINHIQKMAETHRSGYFSFIDSYERFLDFPNYLREEYNPRSTKYLFTIICSQYGDYGIGELTNILNDIST
jgi:hypothetical protein